MEKVKKFIKENKVPIIIAGISIGGAIVCLSRIKSLEKKLYMCQGEKENLGLVIKGLEKSLKNAIYQIGKLSGRKRDIN